MKEVFEYIVSLLKSRIFPMILVFIIMISILVHRLFVLQIVNGDSYVEDLSSSIKKDMSVVAARANVFMTEMVCFLPIMTYLMPLK